MAKKLSERNRDVTVVIPGVSSREGAQIAAVNQEGFAIVGPEPREDETLTVADSRQVLGYGGPLAIEAGGGRGLWKALSGDAIYTLNNGDRYVLPFPLAEALGVAMPEPLEEERLLVDREVDPGDERLTGAALEAAKAGKKEREESQSESLSV